MDHTHDQPAIDVPNHSGHLPLTVIEDLLETYLGGPELQGLRLSKCCRLFADPRLLDAFVREPEAGWPQSLEKIEKNQVL